MIDGRFDAPLTQTVTRFDKYEMNAIAKGVLGPIAIAAIMFWAAGTLAWPWGWAMSVLHLACWVANTIAVSVFDRELLAERGKRRQDTQGWDKALLNLFGLTWLFELLVAAFDRRYGWSTSFPHWLPPFGAVWLVLGFSVITWSMVANRHFEPGVRIQRDREHKVVSSGPYRFVRHPGYAGTIAAYFVGMPCMLGSWLGLVIGVVGISVLLVRTAKEDAFLTQELKGYEAYAALVRYRLLPFVY